jgi:hypothetical protein
MQTLVKPREQKRIMNKLIMQQQQMEMAEVVVAVEEVEDQVEEVVVQEEEERSDQCQLHQRVPPLRSRVKPLQEWGKSRRRELLQQGDLPELVEQQEGEFSENQLA